MQERQLRGVVEAEQILAEVAAPRGPQGAKAWAMFVALPPESQDLVRAQLQEIVERCR